MTTGPTAAERSIDSAYLRPLTIADVLDGMFELLTAHWRVYAVALGVVLLPLNFAVSYLTAQLFGDLGLFEQLSNPAVAEAVFAGGPRRGPLLGLIALSLGSFLFAAPFMNGVACRIAAAGYEHGSPRTPEVLRATVRRYPTLIGITLLFTLSLIVMLLPAAIAFYGAAMTDAADVAVFAGFLVLAAVLGAVVIGVRFSLAYAAAVVEQTGPVASLRRSWQLVGGRFWRVLGTLVLTSFVALLVAQLFALPFSVPGEILGEWVGVVFATVGGVVAAVLSTPLAANAQTLLYFDGRVRVEGYDLDVLSRELLGPAAGEPHG